MIIFVALFEALFATYLTVIIPKAILYRWTTDKNVFGLCLIVDILLLCVVAFFWCIVYDLAF